MIKKTCELMIALVLMLICANQSIAKPASELSKATSESFKDMIDGNATVQIHSKWLANIVCTENIEVCQVTLPKITEKLKAYYAEQYDACPLPFHKNFYEIDCGSDGTLDLRIEFRGTCLYSHSKDEDSGLNVLVYRDKDNKFHTGYAEEFWERSNIELNNLSYKKYGSCGAECFIAEEGVFDKSCNAQPFFELNYDGNGQRILTSAGIVEIVPVMINGNYYYQLFGNSDQEKMKKAVLELVAKYDSILPKPFRSDGIFFSKIVTEEEETRILEAARTAHK